MSKKELWEIFTIFLEMNDCKGSFKYYLNKEHSRYIGNYSWGDLREDFPCDWITDSFSWQETRQGYGYWDKLEDKWLVICRELGVE